MGLRGRAPRRALHVGNGTDGNGIGPRNGADHPTTHSGSSSHHAAERLLHAIGRRGGWSLDALIDKLGLPAQAVAAALTELELRGSIRYRDFAYEPI